MNDVWGNIFKNQWAGRSGAYEIERDDGRVDRFASAAGYFGPPEPHLEGELLSQLKGPVLDLGAGAGSHALYLQNLGLDVTAADFSAGAREVCLGRGCRKVMTLDLRDLRLESSVYGSIIVMGNTIGAHQTPATFPGFLSRLRTAVRPYGRLLFTMIDPTVTTDASHLAYQRSNQEKGLPGGFVRMRVRHLDTCDEWMHLLMLTEQELHQATNAAGWALVDERRRGPGRAKLYENTAS